MALAAGHALAQGAPGVAVQVRLAAAGLDLLQEADVAAGARGGTASPGQVAAPALHLAVGAEAPVVSLPLEGTIVDLGERGGLTGVPDCAPQPRREPKVWAGGTAATSDTVVGSQAAACDPLQTVQSI